MPQGVAWTTPGGGPSLWLEIPRQVDLRQLQERLARRDVIAYSSEGMFLGRPHLHGMRIGYGMLTPTELRRGLELLAEYLRQQMA